MNREIELIVDHLNKVAGVSRETLAEALRVNLLTFSSNLFEGCRDLRVAIGPENRGIRLFVKRSVVRTVGDDLKEISLLSARELQSNVQIGEVLETELFIKNFDHLASQTLKQTVHQFLARERRKSYPLTNRLA